MRPCKLVKVLLTLWPAVAVAGPLADIPLTLKASVPPNVLFALSVEWPTANTPAYHGTNDYSSANAYLGLFDNTKCYDYDSANNWFYPSLPLATDRTCSGKWSGNFLNWAAMTGLDEFRYAMTGGNRYRDTNTETVLERTYQDGQGGTYIFPDKTFTGSGATPYTEALTLTNQGMGVKMKVAGSGSDVVTCSSSSLTGSTFSCSIALQSNGSSGSCASWSGTGTNSSPYKCTDFNAFASGQKLASVTPSTTSSASTGASTTTVSCTNPSHNGTSFGCSLTASDGKTGSCTTWSGSGSSADPFTCSAFGSFSGGMTFSGTGTSTSSFVKTTSGTSASDKSPSCALANSPRRITCALSTGSTATCSSLSGSGTSKSPYVCSGSWTSTGGETNFSHTDGSRTSSSGIYYRPPSPINYRTASTSKTYYYRSSYSGSMGATYYYYSTYNVNKWSLERYVRARVCDPSVGLESNCKLFGTTYKPTGVVQDNGEKMRFGIFSYYNSDDIDNAVMRSKLKYVAPEKYSSGGMVANANKEWNADGTFVPSPDAAESSGWKFAASNSGVINYINKFGSTGSGATRYKSYDNLGKLYYESLNYLRGRSPTSAYSVNATAANSDNFPVVTNWDDPIQYSCQKNYVIAMGDLFTWCDKRLPGGLFSGTNAAECNAKNGQADDKGSLGGDSGVDVGAWTNRLGELEDKVNLSNLADMSAGAASSSSYYISGLAYWARTNDIRPDSGSTKIDGSQTVKTFIIDVQEDRSTGKPGDDKGSSQFWYAAKYGGADRYVGGKPEDWSTSRTVFGTSYSEWPKALLPAGDPESMIRSVREALEGINGETRNEAALAQASGDLRMSTGSFIYRSVFKSGEWSGDVQAFKIDDKASVSSAPEWLAASNLPSPSNRRILTFNDGRKLDGTADTTDTNGRRGVDFTYTNLSLLQKAALDRDKLGTADAHGVERVAYLRGDAANEAPAGLGWRKRASKLGDFINSSPAYVAGPLPFLPGDGYQTFANRVKDRRPMLYVGGNDGMLHGFDASAKATDAITPGKELIAFVPSAVYSNLTRLNDPDYSHKYFVDGSPVVGEACFGGTSCTWKTMLVGGLNAGGRGIYALDVTSPSTFASAAASDLVLWEFTARDDPDLGYTFSKPIIRKMNNGKWAVIFGNGFKNTTADGSGAGVSSTGRAYLYIVFVDGPGAGNAWVEGTHYYKIELKSPSEGAMPTLPLTPPNGLASPAALDTNVDGVIDYIYAGDRYGNVWKFDVTSTAPSAWKAAFGTASAPLPLFSAADSGGNAQPITTGLELSRHPNGGYLVLFGTGSYIETTDPLPDAPAAEKKFKTQSYYGIWDKFDTDKTRVVRSKLQRQTVTRTVVSGGDTFFIQSACRPNYNVAPATTGTDPDCPTSLIVENSPQQLGWVFDLPADGERSVAESPLLEASVLTFTTLSPADDPCDGNTVGREYDLSYLTGGRVEQGVFDLDGNGQLNASDMLIVEGVTAKEGNKVAPSGKVLKGGASERPVRFIPKTKDTTGGTDGGSGTPKTSCTPFIPGWGCPSELGSRRTRAVEDKFSAGNLTETPTGGIGGVKKVLSPQQGRITWRQIIR